MQRRGPGSLLASFSQRSPRAARTAEFSRPEPARLAKLPPHRGSFHARPPGAGHPSAFPCAALGRHTEH